MSVYADQRSLLFNSANGLVYAIEEGKKDIPMCFFPVFTIAFEDTQINTVIDINC